MHRILYMQEILREIFDQFCNCIDTDQVDWSHWQGERNENMLTALALAGTCKTFKEPALDVLWAELQDLAPLVRCLPEVSCLNSDGLYSLQRPLEEADWNVILGFTRRVRVCDLDESFGLAAECIEELSKPPSSIASIFPRLRELAIQKSRKGNAPFFRHLASPRLTTLELDCASMQVVGNAVRAFEECSNMENFLYHSSPWTKTQHDRISGLVRQWPKLRSVQCDDAALDLATLIHLSHISTLQLLTSELQDVVVDALLSTQSGPSTLTFPALVYYLLRSSSLASVWRLFDRLRLPAIEQLHVHLATHPTEQVLGLFLTSLPETCSHQSLTEVFIHVHGFETQALYADPVMDSPPYYINFQHLRSLTIFANIQTIHINIPCGIDLSEQELLRLASSWPHLQTFGVGWGQCQSTASSAITPGGFVQLLDRCQYLRQFSFPFDTRGYTISQGHPWRGIEMLENTVIDVRKSPIEEDFVQALGFFFHLAPFPDFTLKNGWRDYSYRFNDELFELSNLYSDRWWRVYSLARTLSDKWDDLLISIEKRGRIPAIHCDGRDSDDAD